MTKVVPFSLWKDVMMQADNVSLW